MSLHKPPSPSQPAPPSKKAAPPSPALPPALQVAAEAWLAEDPDPTTASELRDLLAAAAKGDATAVADLTERFTGTLEFGTAGLRGVLGAGPQRMNRVLVRKVTAGLAAYLNEHVADATARGVLIGYDGRRNSRVFAEDTARVLGGAGLKVFLAPRPWPTPTTAWGVLDKLACAGVMVTASHNPPAYNGYKVYWGDGAQIIPPNDVGIAAAIATIGASDQLPMPELEELRLNGMLIDLTERLHDGYVDKVVALRAQPQLDGTALVTAYTPLHGVGAASVEAAMKRAGFPELHIEPSQREPDGEFPTVAFPNPEEPGAMDRVLALAAKVHADLVLANDPDADRLCVAVPEPGTTTAATLRAAATTAASAAPKPEAGAKPDAKPDAKADAKADKKADKSGKTKAAKPDNKADPAPAKPAPGAGYRVLSGDQVGVLLADYLLEVTPADKRMVAATLVSSQLLGFLAAAAGADYRETLTGFKWIANAAMTYELEHAGRFVMGYEEALGYSVGPLVRDKDGVSASVLFAELVVWNQARGRTVLEHLDDIYRRVGLFITEQVSLTKPGADGIATIRATMKRFREQPPRELGGLAVESVTDLMQPAADANLPPSDVLVFRLVGGRRVIMRPSGTEPKLKSYYEVRVELADGELMAKARARGEAELAQLRDAHQRLM